MAYGPRPSSLNKRPTPAKRPATVNGRPLGINNRPTSLISFGAVATAAGATVLQSVQSDLGITLNGSTVSAWADQSGSGKDYSQGVAASQPAYNASALNGFPTLTFDGTNDFLGSSLALPTPSVTPTFIWMVFKQVSWAANKRIIGDTSGLHHIVDQVTGSPRIAEYNGTGTGFNIFNDAAAIGSWVRGEFYFSNSTSDFIKLAATTSGTAFNCGNSASTGREIARSGAADNLPSNIEVAAVMYIAGLPSAGVRNALSAAVTAKYGGSVGV